MTAPNLCVAITDEQAMMIRNLMPHGYMKRVFGTLIDEVIRVFQDEGDVALEKILSGEYVIGPKGDRPK